MFELQIALKYLVPKRKSLSTALISLMSVAVISLVVWLVLVFLSVTAGIEKNWLAKLTSLHAPLRITPTEEYYRSYYYQIDSLASASNFTLKTIGEKAAAAQSDPYSETTDMEIPFYWPKSERDEKGRLIDPVKEAVAALEQIDEPGLLFQDYEIGGALLKLDLNRNGRVSVLSQMTYLLSLSDKNPKLANLLLEPSEDDLKQGGEYRAKGEGGIIALPTSDVYPILLPKSYRDSRVLQGDRGWLIYSAPAATTTQEQRIPVRVAGFYDPGILSIGNRCLIVPHEVTRLIYASSQTFSPDGTPGNGFFLWPREFNQIESLKAQISQKFDEAGISRFWKIASYDEFEFAKDLLNQFRSDRTLFTLIAGIILIVACSNIISLLILLVNDKKKEIAILQSMGASNLSIASIFGLCGIAMGLVSCAVGSALALFTLHHLDAIATLLSALQGRAAFNPAFFGQKLPNDLSADSLLFVLIATPILSLLAGLIPALKAIRINPSQVLRSE